MERETIVRDDFPSARKGWDPKAVRAHLEAVAERLPTAPTSLGDDAAARVAKIVAAAEATAAEIESEARERAESTVAEASAEADRIISEARAEASRRVEQAQNAVESLVGQAESLRAQVGSLGEALTDELRDRAAGVKAEISPPSDPTPVPPTPSPEPPVPTPDPDPPVPEPDPGPPDPSPDPGPPAPDPEPEPRTPDPPQPDPGKPTPEPPSPDPAPPGPDRPAPEPPADPEPDRDGEAATASTEDLIAQLRGAERDDAPAVEEEPAANGSDGDQTAARLVAMNLALDGATPEQIATRLEEEFGSLDEAEALIGDVLARAGRD